MKTWIYILIFFPTALITSCSTKINHEKHIPSNASVVAVLDVRRMTIKAFDMSLLIEENMFDQKKGSNKKNKTVPIEESGIDFLDKSYIIAHVADNEADNYIGFIMPLTDPYKFREFAISYAIKKPGEGASNVSYVIVGDGAILGWNTESAIYLINQSIKNEAAITSELFRLFELPEENQMSLQNESFRKAQKEESDISIWMDLNRLNKYRNPLGMIIPGQKVSKGIYNAWIDFEKGAMNVRTRYYISEDEDQEKRDGALVLKETVNKKLLTGIDGSRIFGSLNLGLNIPLIQNQMEKDGMLDNSQSYLDLMNTNAREIFDMLSGDMASVLLDDGDETHFFIALGIKDDQICTKIVNSLAEIGFIRKINGYYTLFNHYIIHQAEGRLVFTTDVSLVEKLDNSDIGIPQNDFIAKLDDNPVVFYLDFKNMPTKSYKKLKTNWKNWPIDSDEIEEMYFAQSSIQDGTSDGEAYILFKNKEKNSLTILAKSLKKISKNIES